MNRESKIVEEAGKGTGWRGSRELWLAAAKQGFLDAGLDAVKIQPLASRLNISRTSFYWFFRDRNALLDALLEEWEATNTGAFIGASEAYAETISEAVLNLLAMFFDETRLEPRFELAVRGWAHQSDTVMARVNAADEIRLAAIRSMYERFGFAPDDADVRARTVYLAQIGYISMQVRETLETRISRVRRYVEIYSGRPPTEREMARFCAGLGVSPEMAGPPATKPVTGG